MPTANPVPSLAPSDMLFNVSTLDSLINGNLLVMPKRLGGTILTWAGLTAQFNGQSEALLAGLNEAAAITETAQNRAAVAVDRAAVDLAREQTEDFANAAASTANEFASKALGLAGTASGGRFMVLPGGVDGLTRATTFKNASGVAVVIVDPVSGSEFDAALPSMAVVPSLVPVVYDTAGKVAAYLLNGQFEMAKGVGPKTLLNLIARLPTFTTSIRAASALVPLDIDEAGKIPSYYINGKLHVVKGLSAAMVADLIAATKATLRYAPLANPLASARPTTTDGRSLVRARSKLAKLKRSANGRVRALMPGDSWCDLPTIPQALANLLYGEYGKSGEGWISVGGNGGIYPLNGVTLTRSGWTLYDVSETTAAPAYGTGIDGDSLSATGTAAVLAIGNLTATEITIYYGQQTGTFRWRVDGGAWTSVTGDGSGGLGKALITGLADAVHTLSIDLTGNAGTAVLHGFYAGRSAVAGIELSKCGNGNIDSSQIPKFMTQITPIATDLAPDVVIIFLGTNCYRRGVSPVSVYIATLTAMVAAYRAAVPGVGFIFVAPADSNGVAVVPLASYRDALYEFCIQGGHEFYNLNEEFGSFATMNALGMWVPDGLHLTDDGGYFAASRLESKFFSL